MTNKKKQPCSPFNDNMISHVSTFFHALYFAQFDYKLFRLEAEKAIWYGNKN